MCCLLSLTLHVSPNFFYRTETDGMYLVSVRFKYEQCISSGEMDGCLLAFLQTKWPNFGSDCQQRKYQHGRLCMLADCLSVSQDFKEMLEIFCWSCEKKHPVFSKLPFQPRPSEWKTEFRTGPVGVQSSLGKYQFIHISSSQKLLYSNEINAILFF